MITTSSGMFVITGDQWSGYRYQPFGVDWSAFHDGEPYSGSFDSESAALEAAQAEEDSREEAGE